MDAAVGGPGGTGAIEEDAGGTDATRGTGAGATVASLGGVDAPGARTPGEACWGVAAGCGGAQGEVAADGPPAEGRIAARVARDRVGPDSADRAPDSVAAATGAGLDVDGEPCCSLGVDVDRAR